MWENLPCHNFCILLLASRLADFCVCDCFGLHVANEQQILFTIKMLF